MKLYWKKNEIVRMEDYRLFFLLGDADDEDEERFLKQEEKTVYFVTPYPLSSS